MLSVYASRPIFRKCGTHLISLDITPASFLLLPTIGITGRRIKLGDRSKLALLNVYLMQIMDVSLLLWSFFCVT